MEQIDDELNFITNRLLTKAMKEEDTMSNNEIDSFDVPPEAGQGSSVREPGDEQTNNDDEVVRRELATAVESQLPSTTFTKIEKSLASLGFFTPSSSRLKDAKVKKINFTREHEGKRVDVTAEIHPSAALGLPVTADQDKYLALQKIITNILQSEGKVRNPIRFKSSDLLRLLGRNTKAGKNYREVSEWLDVMFSTSIISDGVVYEAGKKRFARDRFRVFERAISVGKELPDGSIADANYIWLSDWQLENVNQNFLIPIDLDTYRELKNHIAKALVPLLQVWLYASQKAGSFEKRYEELCQTLNIRVFEAPSLITRQLKPSLDELTTFGYIEKWRIEKTSDRQSYKIIFFHGPKFHRDRRKRLEQKQQTSAPVVVAEFEQQALELPIPGKLEPDIPKPARQPRAQRKGTEQTSTTDDKPAQITTTAAATPTPQSTSTPDAEPDVEAKIIDALVVRGLMPSAVLKLLRSVPASHIEKAPDYIDYWDKVKATKDVGPGLLYKLIETGDPLPATFETQQQQAARANSEERRRKLHLIKESLTVAYEEYRRSVIDRFIKDELTTEEFDKRVSNQLAEISKQPGLWTNRPEHMKSIARHQVRLHIASNLPMLSEEEFCSRELPRMLKELHLDPTEFGIDDLKRGTL